jgi:nucleoside-diphosphate-sugar epimerase
MRVLVTGCNGQVGRAVVARARDAGYRVVGLDMQAREPEVCPTYVASLADPYAIHRAMERFGDCDAVIHLANHTNSEVGPAETVLRENLAFNSSVFVGAAQMAVKRLVFSSSVQAMLGGIERWRSQSDERVLPPELPVTERVEPRPSNSYGLSKLMTERMLEGLASRAFGNPETTAVSVRLPFVLSRGAFERTAQNVGVPEYRWGGCEAFAYLHEDDAGDALVRAAELEKPGHHVVWCAAPDPRPGATVEAIVERYYTDVPGAERAVAMDILHDCSEAERLLGWRAERLVRNERAKQGLEPAGVEDVKSA